MSSKKDNQKALIIGCNGQDGTLLTKFLVSKNYNVYGITKDCLDITSSKQVSNLLERFKPQEIYYLAAYHHSSENRENIDIKKNYGINYFGVIIFLEAIRKFDKKIRFFFASSSFIFKPSRKIQTEKTKYEPQCHYSVAKVASMNACKFYRERYGLYASCGILYNHESILRKDHFLSKKIISHAIKHSRDYKLKLIINNMNDLTDWGFAEDYVRAMHLILKNPISKTYIIASGKVHSVRDFVKTAYNYLNLDYRDFVEEKCIDKISTFRKGDYSMLKKDCGWEPYYKFTSMIKRLVNDGLEKL